MFNVLLEYNYLLLGVKWVLYLFVNINSYIYMLGLMNMLQIRDFLKNQLIGVYSLIMFL